MSLQQEILPNLVDAIRSYYDECSILLIGSAVHGAERPDSDLDLNLFFSEKSGAISECPYVDTDNRWQLKVKQEIRGIRIDVAWETYEYLAKRLEGDGSRNCWPFSNGKILHDDHGRIRQYLDFAKTWFEQHPVTAKSIEAEYTVSKQKQLRKRGAY